jgi:hypothetical protein
MKLAVLATIAVAIVIGTGRPAVAQRSIHIGVAGGAAFPVGVLDNGYTAGPAGRLSLAFGSTDTPIGLRLDYEYAGFRGRTDGDVKIPDFHINSVTANLVIPFRVGYVKPYIIGGGGMYPMRLPGATKRENDWGANGGVGVGFPLPYTSLGAFVEARYHDVNRSNASAYHFIPITLGILF